MNKPTHHAAIYIYNEIKHYSFTDVVIPTNSSDKSNIILKAGQRVMVLKSSKGIYMQLDSGKIIAIRTTSKRADSEKSNKDDVIDITSDCDTDTPKSKSSEKGKQLNFIYVPNFK